MTKESSKDQPAKEKKSENKPAPIPENFRDDCYRVEKSDQMSYLWPFTSVSCPASPKIELRSAGEMGLGIFATDDIEEGEYLCCYFGKLMHIPEEYSDYTFDIKTPNDAYCMTVDSKYFGNISRYFNHSYTPNCTSRTEFHYADWQKSGENPYSPNQDWQYTPSKDDPNRHYYYRDGHESVWDKPESNLVRWPIAGKEEPHITFRTNKKIKKDEQLFIDYGKAYWETRTKKPI